MNAEVGDSIYCPQEGWSGTVEDIVEDDMGLPAVAILKTHDPADGPWICVPLSAYLERDKAETVN